MIYCYLQLFDNIYIFFQIQLYYFEICVLKNIIFQQHCMKGEDIDQSFQGNTLKAPSATFEA